MSFARVHKWIAYASAVLGLLALTLGPYLEPLPATFAFVLVVVSWFVEGDRIQQVSWTRGWTAAVIALLVLQVIRGIFSGSILGLTLEFAAGLQVSRLFNRKSAREYQQIGALSLLHLIVGTVLSTELAYGLVFTGFVVVTPWILTLSHLRAEIEDHHGPKAGTPGADVARVLASKRLVGPRFFASTALLSVPLFAMTGFLFLMFPRVGLGFLSFDRSFGQPVSGFGGDVELGDFGVIRMDPTVVLRVIPPDLEEGSAPELRPIRMRGTSFNRYDGRRWTRSRDALSESVGHMEASYPIPVRFHYPGRDARWEVILDALEEPVLFLPPDTVGLEIPPRMVGGLATFREIEIAKGTDIRYADGDGLGLRYFAWTSSRPEDLVTTPLSAEDRASYVEVPPGHERVAELARTWTEGAGSDEERVARIWQELQRFDYSLEMPALDGRLPLDVFLFEARRGHCEYFSTAMAVMLRTLDVPTRNVTGFLGGRFNQYGGYYELSQGDAHSWVEVFMSSQGWVMVDPTPPARSAITPDPGMFGPLRQLLDAVRTRWAEDVVGFDLRRQVGLARVLRGWLRGTAPTADDPDTTQAASPTRTIPGGVIVAIVGVLLALGYAVLRWRRRSQVPALARETRAVIDLYAQLDRALAKLGRPRPASRAPLERLDELEAARFAELELAREVTDAYLNARYGRAVLDLAEVARLRERVRALARRRDLFGPDV